MIETVFRPVFRSSLLRGVFPISSGEPSPDDLFSSGAPGVFLDPSDLTTMFSDRAGTIPITTPGTVVGKRLDKSGLGNHATAPTDAARPTYGIEPQTGRRNLLLATATLATQSLTVTAAAHTLAFTGTGTVTLSGASTAGPLVGTGAGNRVSLTFTPTAGSLTLTVLGSVTLAQLELGSTATAYQNVTTAFDVTEAGVPTIHYVQYNGLDSSLATPSINFTATDKMSVFVGVRKSSDAAAGTIAELSASASANNGAFILRGPFTASANYGYFSRGTAGVTATTPASYAAPIKNIVTALSDISGDRATVRANGVQAAQSVADQGTGNFGNYPIYIGRRGGTSIPFNGRDYGIIIVGKATTALEISSTESWLAAKTGVTLP